MQPDNDFIVIGIVGHVRIDDLKDLKDQIESIPFFKIVYFKTSSDKLWIKEGDAP